MKKEKEKKKTRSFRSSCFFSQKRNLSFPLSAETKRRKREKERENGNNRINIWSVTGRNGGKFEIRDGMKNHLRTSPSAAARTPVSHGMFIMQSASMGEQERVRVSQPSIAAGTRIAAPIPTKAGLVKPIRVDKQVKRLRRWKATGANDNANNNSRAMREPRWLSSSAKRFNATKAARSACPFVACTPTTTTNRA